MGREDSMSCALVVLCVGLGLLIGMMSVWVDVFEIFYYSGKFDIINGVFIGIVDIIFVFYELV